MKHQNVSDEYLLPLYYTNSPNFLFANGERVLVGTVSGCFFFADVSRGLHFHKSIGGVLVKALREALLYATDARSRAERGNPWVHRHSMWIDLDSVDAVAIDRAISLFQSGHFEEIEEASERLELISAVAVAKVYPSIASLKGRGEDWEYAVGFVEETLSLMKEYGIPEEHILHVVFVAKWWFTTILLRMKFLKKRSHVLRRNGT